MYRVSSSSGGDGCQQYQQEEQQPGTSVVRTQYDWRLAMIWIYLLVLVVDMVDNGYW